MGGRLPDFGGGETGSSMTCPDPAPLLLLFGQVWPATCARPRARPTSDARPDHFGLRLNLWLDLLAWRLHPPDPCRLCLGYLRRPY